MFAIDFVNQLRDKVVAGYRLHKVNHFVEELQRKTAELENTNKANENLAARLSELETDGWAVPVDRIREGKTTEEIKTEVKDELTKEQEETGKRIETLNGRIAELNEEIGKVVKGEKPYRLSRETVSERVDKLLDGMTADLSLEDVSGANDKR